MTAFLAGAGEGSFAADTPKIEIRERMINWVVIIKYQTVRRKKKIHS